VKLKLPVESVSVDRENPLTGLCISMVAPTTAAFEGSKTVPLMLAEFPVCAFDTGTISRDEAMTIAKNARNIFLRCMSLSS